MDDKGQFEWLKGAKVFGVDPKAPNRPPQEILSSRPTEAALHRSTRTRTGASVDGASEREFSANVSFSAIEMVRQRVQEAEPHGNANLAFEWLPAAGTKDKKHQAGTLAGIASLRRELAAKGVTLMKLGKGDTVSVLTLLPAELAEENERTE